MKKPIIYSSSSYYISTFGKKKNDHWIVGWKKTSFVDFSLRNSVLNPCGIPVLWEPVIQNHAIWKVLMDYLEFQIQRTTGYECSRCKLTLESTLVQSLTNNTLVNTKIYIYIFSLRENTDCTTNNLCQPIFSFELLWENSVRTMFLPKSLVLASINVINFSLHHMREPEKWYDVLCHKIKLFTFEMLLICFSRMNVLYPFID